MGRLTRSDSELIAACRGGDREAFGEIVERYQRAVSAVSYSGTRDRVLGEDVTQETFVTAWRQLHALRDADRLPAWLCGIARNLARTARRKRGREAVLDDDVVGGSTPYEQLSDREDEHVVASSLAKVPDTYREALVLFYCEQQSVKAVAQALGITENATHQRLARGRQHLADNVGLVERSLERRRPQAGLVAAVLAAIAAFGSSQVEAATRTRTQGSTMFKFGIAAALLTATATTGYVVARSNTEPAQAEPVAVSTGASTDRAAAPTAVPRNAITTTVAAGSTGATGSAASSDDPLGCANVSRHLAMVMAQTQSDLVEWLEQGHIADVERQMKPIADRYFEDCTKLEWSLAIRTCIGSIDDIVALQAKCEPPPTLPPERRTVTAPGETMIIDEEPRPAYTGSDHSCASVARHMLLLASPSKSMLARLPDDQREGIRDAMERMLHNFPETVEINCETTPWSLEDRRCILGSTTEAKAIECTRKKKTS